MKFRRLAAGFTAILVGVTTMASGNAVPLLQPGASFKAAVSSGAEPAAARRSVAVRGPHDGMAARTNVVRPGARPVHPIARPGVRPGAKPVHPIARPGRPSVRPPYYTWRPGGAIAAGAALGFVAASAAVAYAGAPPVPGYCWYYTDFSRTQGFWDVCP